MPMAIRSESPPPSSKPVLPVISGEDASDKTPSVETTDCLNTATTEKTTEAASVGTVKSGEKKEEIVKKRPKPSLQKASRLRNSLLFSSNIEQHQSQWEKDSSGQNKTDDHSHSGGLSKLSQSSEKSDSAPRIDVGSTSFKRQASFTMGDQPKQGEFQSKVLQRTTAMLNLSDPDSRLQFFRELAAQRKRGRMAASAKTTTGENSEKPDKNENMSATEGNVSVPEQSTLDPLSKIPPARESNSEVPQVLDDDAKTLKAQSAPESHAGKDLSDNSGHHSSKTGFAETATDTEKMKQMKLNVESPAELHFATLASSTEDDLSSAIKDIPKDVMSHENQASKKEVVQSSTLRLPLSPGKAPNSSTSHPVKSISIVEDTQEDICSNHSNKPLDSDASSVCSSVEMGSGTEFATAPSSPCTPTPTEYCPVPPKEKIAVVSAAAETLGPSTSSSAKSSSPQRIPSTNTGSELEKCSSASHALTTKPCTSSPPQCDLVTEPDSTEHNVPPVSSTGDSHPHTPVKVSAQDPVKAGDIASSQTAIPTSNNSNVESPTKTKARLASVSSPAKPCETEVVSPTKSKLPQAGDTAQTSPVASTHGSTKTKQKQNTKSKHKNKASTIPSPLKSTPTEMAPLAESTLTSTIKIRDTISVPSSFKTEEVLDASASPATNIADSLTTTDSSLSPSSSTTKTNPMTNLAPTGNSSSPETKISESSTSIAKGTSSSPHNSPTNIPAIDVCIEGSSSSDDLIKNNGNLTLNITQSEGCSSPMECSTILKEAELTTESSSQSPSTNIPSPKPDSMSPTVSSLDSPTETPSNSQPVSSPTNTSPVVKVSPIQLTSPHDVKKLVSSPLLQLIQTDSNLQPTAATDSLAKPTSPAFTDSASPSPETAKSPDYPLTDEPTSPPAISVFGDSCKSKLLQATPALPTEESAETTSNCDKTAPEGPLGSGVKDMPENCPSADVVKLSKESPAEETDTTTSRNSDDVEDPREQRSQSTKDAVTSPSEEDSKDQKSESPKDSVTSPGTEGTEEQKSQSTEHAETSSTEDSKEQKSPSAEPTKSPPSRYQSSTANVLSCSNLRDDTKVLLEQISANSQSRAAKQTLPNTDDAKEDEITGPNEKSKQNLTSRFKSRGSHMSDKERDRLITAMESKRKERKVYSRFEVSNITMSPFVITEIRMHMKLFVPVYITKQFNIIVLTYCVSYKGFIN